MNTKLLASVLVSGLVLTACGGGGSSTTATQPTVTPDVTVANLQLSVPAPSYGAGSPQLSAFNAINSYRQKLGLGLWAQNLALDQASQAHATYSLETTLSISPHLEDPSQPGFTGATYDVRDLAAGYKGSPVSEVMGIGTGAQAIDRAMNTVYHRRLLMEQSATEAGIGMAYSANAGTYVNVIDFGFTKAQNNASDFVVVYPMDKQTGIFACMQHENPNPYPTSETAYTAQFSAPGAAANGYSCLGIPGLPSSNITIDVATGKTLVVTSFIVTEAGQTAPLDAWVMANGVTFDGSVLDPSWSVLTAKSPFKLNTTYNVAFTGSVDGAPLTKNWSFTTGAIEMP